MVQRGGSSRIYLDKWHMTRCSDLIILFINLREPWRNRKIQYLFWYPKRRVMIRSCEVLKPQDWRFEWAYLEIWQAAQQSDWAILNDRSYHTSERWTNSKYNSHSLETLKSWDKTYGCLVMSKHTWMGHGYTIQFGHDQGWGLLKLHSLISP